MDREVIIWEEQALKTDLLFNKDSLFNSNKMAPFSKFAFNFCLNKIARNILANSRTKEIIYLSSPNNTEDETNQKSANFLLQREHAEKEIVVNIRINSKISQHFST
jgi:hypothetical protein